MTSLLLLLPVASTRPTDSLSGWLHGTHFRQDALTIEIFARDEAVLSVPPPAAPPAASTSNEAEAVERGIPWPWGGGSSGPAAPPPPPSPPWAVSVSIHGLDCHGISVEGLSSSVSDTTPPTLSLSLGSAGFSCFVERLDVQHGGAGAGAAGPVVPIRLSDHTVSILGQLTALTPLSRVGISGAGVSADFAVTLTPTGASGLPAALRLDRSSVSIPTGGLAVDVESTGGLGDVMLEGVASLVSGLLSTLIASRVTAELELAVALDINPALAALEHEAPELPPPSRAAKRGSQSGSGCRRRQSLVLLRAGAPVGDGDGVLEAAISGTVRDVFSFAVRSADRGAVSRSVEQLSSRLLRHEIGRLLGELNGTECADAPLPDPPPGGAAASAAAPSLAGGGCAGEAAAEALREAGEAEGAFPEARAKQRRKWATLANRVVRAAGLEGLDLPGEVAAVTVVAPLAKPTPVGIGVGDVSLSGLDTAEELGLTVAECGEGGGGGDNAGGGATVAGERGSFAAARPFELGMTLRVSLLGATLRWRANFTASALSAAAAEAVAFSARQLERLSLADLASPCALSPLHGLRLDALGASAETFQLSLTPLPDGGADGGVGGGATSTLSTAFLGQLLGAVKPGTVEAVNEAASGLLGSAHRACASGDWPPSPPESQEEGMPELAVLCGIYGTALAIIGLVVCVHVCGSPRSALPIGDEESAAEDAAIVDYYPLWYGRLLSGLLLLNIGLFLLANSPLVVGALVRANVSVAGAPLPPLNSFQFTLAESVIRFWRTGGMGFLLSSLIAVYSGVWPYVKLSLTLFCLWAPPRVLPERRRNAMLGVFEAMGKWSLIDSLMIFILMAAMKMDFDIPPADGAANATAAAHAAGAAPPVASVSVEVMPTGGITLFTLGVVLSLVLTAAVVHMHKTLRLPHHHPCEATEPGASGGPRCEGDEFLVRARHALAVGVGEADGDAADNERLKYASAALPLGHRSSLSRVLCTVAARSRGATASPCSGEARRRLMTREKEPKGARRDWAAKE
ncbi:hypothetical protein EMIHUDRAFT_470336 [Emiliania huxleyi CCMP1516]|uniref:SMP-LTD domain-containing protein n=3 Tax=Emiliania huxleyi TaxID=2903 RepID=A0A0D3J0R4_EMIH1|nr:hypothetical protein EMIHUDRAFT_470336 [Emiliania huxleyi CCMP1516]EOD17099.1 hypothetical protein EMIHUDRAFT_470336 [Emiliania huxleyi CCMP1516]|eukprot:XP_005769528.1 hypothetical protein EMIHUDRAFT_470336 [Emiliania huxleyi CCMP1516]